MVRVEAAHPVSRKGGRRAAPGSRAGGASLRRPGAAHKLTASSLVLCLISAMLALSLLAPVASAQATTIFSDNFDAAFSGWTLSGTGNATWYAGVPRNGTHSIQLIRTRAMQRIVSTACYQSITVSFYMGADSLEGTEYVRASWYNGSAWQPLKQINNGDPEEDNALHPFAYSLPAGAANNPNFTLRFEVAGNNNQDYAYVDDVVVQGDLIQYSLDLTRVGNGQVRVNGTLRSLPWSGTFGCRSVVDLEAVPDAGWQFDGWSGDLTGSTNPTTIGMDGNKAVTANFSQIQYTLSLTGVGNGQVRVNGTLRALPWSGSFVIGSVVNLQAVPDAGWQFDNWSGDLSGSINPTTITMDGNKSVTANFSEIQYTLSLTGAGNGQVRVNGTLHALPWSGSFVIGSVVNLQAVPDAGWQFDNWSGDLSGSINPTTVTMDAAKAVTATFSRVQYTLNLTGVGSGSVRVDGTLHALPWSSSFVSDTTVTLEAVAAGGWSFVNWSGSVTSSEVTIVVVMDGNKTIAASFTQQPVLQLTKVGNGSVRVNGTLRTLPWSGAFAAGAVVTLEAVPDAGWQFSNWSGDVSWSGSTLVVTMTGNKSIVANFSQQPTLTIAVNGHGSVRVDGVLHALPWSGGFDAGAEVTLEAVPDAGWQFDGWTGDVTWGSALLIITVDRSKNLVATFSGSDLYTLTLSGTGNGSVQVNGTLRALPWSGSFAADAEVTLEAVPDADWSFVGWSGDASGPTSPIVVTMDRNRSITASFAQEFRQISVSAFGSGTVKLNGSALSLPYSGTVGYGSSITLEATADYGWRFTGWSGSITSDENPTVVAVDDDLDIVANFILPDTYFLTISNTGAGSVSVNGTIVELPWTGEFARGEEVRLEAKIEGEQEFYGWSGDASGTTKTIMLLMDADKQVTAEFMCIATFPDVPCDYWCVDAIEAVYLCDIIEGYRDGLYRPRLTVDRGAMAVYVSRGLSGGKARVPAGPAEPTFPDVPTDFWAYDAVEYAVANNVVQGYLDGKYHADWDVTRGQMAVFIARAIVTPTGEAGLADYQPPARPTFDDVPTTYWSYKHIEYLAQQGVVRGYVDGYYRPGWYVTRDQMAVYIARAFELPL